MARALRNCWCTPKWLAELIGPVDLDPCSNERSHIQARVKLTSDGLKYYLHPELRVYINPPYGPGEVIKWVRYYRYTQFIYCLRWDTSTKWFAELIPSCTHVWFPPCRVDFEPPPRIKESSNPYPHALYLRDPPPDLISRLSRAGYLFRVDADFLAMLDRSHGTFQSKGSRRAVGIIGGAEGDGGDDLGGEGGTEAAGGGPDERERGPTVEVTEDQAAATKRHWEALAEEARRWAGTGSGEH